jgi:hypothetical protein
MLGLSCVNLYLTGDPRLDHGNATAIAVGLSLRNMTIYNRIPIVLLSSLSVMIIPHEVKKYYDKRKLKK